MPERFDHFATWSQFIDHVALGETDFPMEQRSSRSEDHHHGITWTGTANYADAVQLARQGWRDGVAQVQELSGTIESRLYNLISLPRIAYDVTGELLDVGRFASGEPEHWGNWEHTLTEGKGTKHIHIVVNVIASAGVSSEVLMQRGAAVAALINLLELAGHRCKVDMVCADGCNGFHYEIRTAVKEYDETLDLDRVTYAVAHPSVLRRHFFSAVELLPEDYRRGLNVGSGYGRCQETKESRGDIYLPMMEYGDPRWESPENATAWVNQELIRLGVLQSDLQPR